jgi:hypothetical protein
VAWQARSVLHRLLNPNQPNPYMEGINGGNNAGNSRMDSSTRIKAVTSRELP